MSDSEPRPGQRAGRPVGRLTDEQRAGLAAAAPEDRNRMQQEIRRNHVRLSLDDAVAEGRLSQADADTVVDRLRCGEDAHQIRRELRGLGVLLGRTDQPGRGSATTPPQSTTAEDSWRNP